MGLRLVPWPDAPTRRTIVGVPAGRRNGDPNQLAGTPQPVISQWDVFFLEAISYHGHLSTNELIALGLSHGVDTADTKAWINDAASRGAIALLEPGSSTRWGVAS